MNNEKRRKPPVINAVIAGISCQLNMKCMVPIRKIAPVKKLIIVKQVILFIILF